ASDQLFYRRHRIGQVVAWCSEVAFTEEPVDGPGQDSGHETAAGIHPVRIAALHCSVADKARPGRAQGDQLMRVYRKVGSRLWRIGGAILDEIPSHPVIPTAGQILDSLAKNVPVELDASFTGGSDKADRDALVERFCHYCGLPITRKAFDGDLLWIDH